MKINLRCCGLHKDRCRRLCSRCQTLSFSSYEARCIPPIGSKFTMEDLGGGHHHYRVIGIEIEVEERSEANERITLSLDKYEVEDIGFVALVAKLVGLAMQEEGEEK